MLGFPRRQVAITIIDPHRAAPFRGYPTVCCLTRLHAREREREKEEREKAEGERREGERRPTRAERGDRGEGQHVHAAPACTGTVSPASCRPREGRKRGGARAGPPEEKEEKEREGEGGIERDRRKAEPENGEKNSLFPVQKPTQNAHPEPNKSIAITRNGVRVPKPFRKTHRNKNRTPKNKAKTGRTFSRRFREAKKGHIRAQKSSSKTPDSQSKLIAKNPPGKTKDK